MTIAQFLRLNFGDAERRLARLTAADADDEAALWAVLNQSLPGRGLTAIATQFGRAVPGARVSQRWQRAASAWLELSPVLRMRSIGAIALTAAAVHIALVLTVRPVGLWWLIVPGMVATFGAVALVLSWSAAPLEGGSR